MTTLPTSTYGPGYCHLCAQHTETLIHDGRGFLLCEDSLSCIERVKRLDRAEYADLQTEAKRLQARLSMVLKRQGELEKELGLYDLAVEENRAEVARIEEGKC